MDYKEISKAIRICGSEPSFRKCEKECPYYEGGDMIKCIPRMTKDSATAITELLEEVERVKAERDSARHNLQTIQKMVQEYQEEIIPGFRERAEKAEAQRDELFGILNGVCRDVREKSADEYVCGLCEYDGAYITESGDWANECPGFDMDDCFCMKKSMRKKFCQKEE